MAKRESAYGFSATGVIIETRFEEALKALSETPKLLRHAIRESLRGEATEFAEKVKHKRFSRASTKTRNLSDKVRDPTGKMQRSIKPFAKGARTYGRKEQSVGSIYAGIRSGHPLTHIHEFGAKPKPDKGRYIAVPLADARTARGKQKANAGEWNNTYVRKSAKGHLIVWGPKNPKNTITKTGKVRKPYPLFVLLKEAQIPARLKIGEMMMAEREQWFRAVERAVGQVAREWTSARAAALSSYPRAA